MRWRPRLHRLSDAQSGAGRRRYSVAATRLREKSRDIRLNGYLSLRSRGDADMLSLLVMNSIFFSLIGLLAHAKDGLVLAHLLDRCRGTHPRSRSVSVRGEGWAPQNGGRGERKRAVRVEVRQPITRRGSRAGQGGREDDQDRSRPAGGKAPAPSRVEQARAARVRQDAWTKAPRTSSPR